MNNYDLSQIKSRLKYGDIEYIAKKTGFHPNYVGKVLLGHIKLTNHNERIVKAAQLLADKRQELETELTKI